MMNMHENEAPSARQMELLNDLKKYLKNLGSVAVAFSGGVDSTFLLKTAVDVLGDRAAAVTISSCLFPKREFHEAQAFCEQEGIRFIVCESEALKIEGFSQNPKDRCYLCKKDIFGKIVQIAKENGLAYVVEGSNLDDEGDYRPGHRAVAELGIVSPLRECGFTKDDIRTLSRFLKLPVWDKPSMACLASRFVYGERITGEKLDMVDRAEQLLLDLGFRQMRVRIHGKMARIEVVPEEFAKIMEADVRKTVCERLRSFGFTYVTLDLMGYRTGSMNETLGAGSGQ